MKKIDPKDYHLMCHEVLIVVHCVINKTLSCGLISLIVHTRCAEYFTEHEIQTHRYIQYIGTILPVFTVSCIFSVTCPDSTLDL